MSDVKGVPVHQLHQDAQDAEVPENAEVPAEGLHEDLLLHVTLDVLACSAH